MKTFNEKQILKHKTTFAFVAKTMTALSRGSHVYTEDELRSSHLEGKDAELFHEALSIPYLDDSQELRFWVYSTDLKALRESFNYTQRELAKHLGISQSVLCHLEKKDIAHISDDIIQKVYEFYQHPINKAINTNEESEVMRLFKKSGLSRSKLVKLSGLPYSTVRDILTGRTKSTSKQTRLLIDFLKKPINEDTHFAEVRNFCINELSDKLKGHNRVALAKELGVHVSYFSKCIHDFDHMVSEVTPSLERIYNYFHSEPTTVSEPVVSIGEPVRTYVDDNVKTYSFSFSKEQVDLIRSLVDKEIASLELQLQDALAEHDYFKVSAIASELNKLSTLKGE